MILGLGADLVRVARLKAALIRHPRLHQRLFTAGELAQCHAAADPYPKLGARFAAKEAFLKALGTGWAEGIAWTDVEVAGGGKSAPSLTLHGRAAELAAQMGVVARHLSLSHDGDYAFAVCTLEGP